VGPSDAELAARELARAGGGDDSRVASLLDAIDQARIVHLDAVKRLSVAMEVRVVLMRRVAVAHQQLISSVTASVIDSSLPATDALQAAAAQTAKLRAQVARGEARLSEVERVHTTQQQTIKLNLPPRSHP
jgi:hypothetical protein